jgi:hypothetical protein
MLGYWSLLPAPNYFATYSETLATSGSNLLHYKAEFYFPDKNEIKMLELL